MEKTESLVEMLTRIPPEMRDLQSIESVPGHPTERYQLNSLISETLVQRFYNWLPTKLQAAFEALSNGAETPEQDTVLGLLDSYFLKVAAELGPVIFCCDAFVKRLFQWRNTEPRGPELFRNLGQSLEQAAVLRQGGGAKLVETAVVEAREELISELPQVQQIEKDCNDRGRLRDTIAVLERVVDPFRTKEQTSNSFPQLTKNWKALTSFIEANAALTRDLLCEMASPTTFVDTWIAHIYGIQVSSVPVIMSRLKGSRPRTR